ncbi:MAG: hypothetical protein ACM3O4_02630 [Ignavibacteriales bacterium]
MNSIIKSILVVVILVFISLVATSSNKMEEKTIDKKIVREEASSNYAIPEEEPTLVEEPMTEVETVQYFNTVEEEVNEYVNFDNFDNVKDKLNDLFISTVDFVFYGKEINGVTFNDLTEETKNQILIILERIDNAIEFKQPGYKVIVKDKSSELYDNVSEKIKEGLNYTDNFLEEKIGEERYQGIKDATKEFGSDVKDITIDAFNDSKEIVEKGFGYLKGWYEDVRDN